MFCTCTCHKVVENIKYLFHSTRESEALINRACPLFLAPNNNISTAILQKPRHFSEIAILTQNDRKFQRELLSKTCIWDCLFTPKYVTIQIKARERYFHVDSDKNFLKSILLTENCRELVAYGEQRAKIPTKPHHFSVVFVVLCFRKIIRKCTSLIKKTNSAKPRLFANCSRFIG